MNQAADAVRDAMAADFQDPGTDIPRLLSLLDVNPLVAQLVRDRFGRPPGPLDAPHWDVKDGKVYERTMSATLFGDFVPLAEVLPS